MMSGYYPPGLIFPPTAAEVGLVGVGGTTPGVVVWRSLFPSLHFGCNNSGLVGARRFLSDNMSQNANVLDIFRQPIPFDCRCLGLLLTQNVPGTADAVNTYRVVLAGIDTAIAVVLSNASGALVTDLSNFVDANQGDFVSLAVDKTAAPATAALQVSASLVLHPRP